MRFAFLIPIVLFFASPASAISLGASSIIEVEIEQACNGGQGTFQTSLPVELDLNADGQLDLIFNHSDITCANGSRSIFCGAQVCTHKIYVMRNGYLEEAIDNLSLITSITPGAYPRIALYFHGGRTGVAQWNGYEFQLTYN